MIKTIKIKNVEDVSTTITIVNKLKELALFYKK